MKAPQYTILFIANTVVSVVVLSRVSYNCTRLLSQGDKFKKGNALLKCTHLLYHISPLETCARFIDVVLCSH